MNIQMLCCGYIRVSETVPFGNAINLKNTARQLTEPERSRVTLPVFSYLIEHPRGPILVDGGWCRAVSPAGVYDPKAAASLLTPALAALYQPWVPEGMTVSEQLSARGLRPEDLSCAVLTHLDPDHVSGLRDLKGLEKIILPEDEYFWSCRTVYKARQPRSLWQDLPIERVYYRGSPLGPNRWAIDLFGDESVVLVNLPGHTDGQAGVLVRSGGRFVLLCADAAFSPRNWRQGLTPGYGFSRAMQLRSLHWIAEQERDPGCAAILCSHDAAITPQTIAW